MFFFKKRSRKRSLTIQSHVQALMESLASTPGKANNVLDALRAMCRWAMGPHELLSHDPTVGVSHFEDGEGHKPWTPEQLRAADEKFTGMLRRAYVLARYTGQRIRDVVRLGFTDIDEGGFALRQKKNGVQPWCPIFPELEAEMATWEKRPGPFLLQEEGKGKPFTTNQGARGAPRVAGCRRADRKAGGQAVLLALKQGRNGNGIVKR
jgi:integrase